MYNPLPYSCSGLSCFLGQRCDRLCQPQSWAFCFCSVCAIANGYENPLCWLKKQSPRWGNVPRVTQLVIMWQSPALNTGWTFDCAHLSLCCIRMMMVALVGCFSGEGQAQVFGGGYSARAVWEKWSGTPRRIPGAPFLSRLNKHSCGPLCRPELTLAADLRPYLEKQACCSQGWLSAWS